MFFPNDAELCSKKSLEQLSRYSIYKLTILNFNCSGGGEAGGGWWARWERGMTDFVESSLEQLKISPGFQPLVKMSCIEVQVSETSARIPWLGCRNVPGEHCVYSRESQCPWICSPPFRPSLLNTQSFGDLNVSPVPEAASLSHRNT